MLLRGCCVVLEDLDSRVARRYFEYGVDMAKHNVCLYLLAFACLCLPLLASPCLSLPLHVCLPCYCCWCYKLAGAKLITTLCTNVSSGWPWNTWQIAMQFRLRRLLEDLSDPVVATTAATTMPTPTFLGRVSH